MKIMNLNEFLNHIKHNSLVINIFTGARIEFLGTVGEFKTAVVKEKLGKCLIDKIETLTQELNIFLMEVL